jgi:hypothetical protein
MFVERPENHGRMIVDFQLCDSNYHYAPKGTIRIARFTDLFYIEKHRGYYGDIYMKRFIRKWKTKTYQNIQRRKDKQIAEKVLADKFNTDVNGIIMEFL